MAYQEDGRQHLSPDILRRIDTPTLPYQEMEPGQALRIHAQDAVTRDQSSFGVSIVSVRDNGRGNGMKTATLLYTGGQFNFFDGNKPQQPVQLESGTLMENGISGVLVPQTDMRMVYVGGIGLGRDHSFEFVGGKDRSVIAQRLSKIEIGNPPLNYQAPDITGHLQRVAATEERQIATEAGRIARVDRIIMEDMEEFFSDHPDYEKMRALIADYSANGKIVMSSFLIYGKEDGVLDKAWQALQEADRRHFSYEHPRIRGDLDFKASSRAAYLGMVDTAGIQWPRPEPTSEKE